MDSASYNALAIGDACALQESVAPRYQPRASWLSNRAVANAIYRMVAADEPQAFNDDRSRLLGKPWNEAGLDSTTTAGDEPLLYGNLDACYRIVDRIGATLEVVPMSFDGDGSRLGSVVSSSTLA